MDFHLTVLARAAADRTFHMDVGGSVPNSRSDGDPVDPAFMSAMVTEHFVLQSAASATISEAGTRTSVYLVSLSTSLVALGFTVNTPAAFVPLASAVIPTLLLLGLFTVVRLVDTSVENVALLRRIARIRSFYATLSPDAPSYFPSTGSDALDAHEMLGIRYGRYTLLFTLASTVGTVNAVLAGAGTTLLLHAGMGTSLVLGVCLGAGVTVSVWLATVLYQQRRFAEAFPVARP
jgi:hypothetical protein